jgi:hypothetical protein
MAARLHSSHILVGLQCLITTTFLLPVLIACALRPPQKPGRPSCPETLFGAFRVLRAGGRTKLVTNSSQDHQVTKAST